mmetsp:Transcript_7993/g.25052  ORF Transcript_7993/g.25052 Transcript_7993/m.25052 type:complete len:212 (+) Transcript_7993:150-785(+)
MAGSSPRSRPISMIYSSILDRHWGQRLLDPLPSRLLQHQRWTGRDPPTRWSLATLATLPQVNRHCSCNMPYCRRITAPCTTVASPPVAACWPRDRSTRPCAYGLHLMSWARWLCPPIHARPSRRTRSWSPLWAGPPTHARWPPAPSTTQRGSTTWPLARRVAPLISPASSSSSPSTLSTLTLCSRPPRAARCLCSIEGSRRQQQCWSTLQS